MKTGEEGEEGRQDAEEGVAESLEEEREGREGGEAKNREGVLLMISPPAVGLGWSEGRERRGRREGGRGRKGGTVAEETK